MCRLRVFNFRCAFVFVFNFQLGLWICLGYRVYILDSCHVVSKLIFTFFSLTPDRSHSWRRPQDPRLFAHKAQPRFRRSVAYDFFSGGWGAIWELVTRCRSQGVFPQPTGPNSIFRTISTLISAQDLGSRHRQPVSTFLIPLFRILLLLRLQCLPHHQSLLVCLHRQS